MDELGGLLGQAAGGSGSASEIHGAFDRVAQAVPQGALADGLAHAFRSEQTPPFPQMVASLFSASTGDQKAGLLNQLVSSIGPGGASQALQALGGGGIASLLSGGNVTPEQAQQVTPEAVQALAQHAQNNNPSILDATASFYAQHSALVKTIGAGALSLVMSRISAGAR
ncbi:MAG TPA: hypothetical protein VMW75_23205 [Thermoanaerobaculia bacterium]|nr:hypothetical protein [Thermoanaerobaculia bacterium]